VLKKKALIAAALAIVLLLIGATSRFYEGPIVAQLAQTW